MLPLLLSLACGSDPAQSEYQPPVGESGPGEGEVQPGVGGTIQSPTDKSELSEIQQQQLQQLETSLSVARDLDADALLAKRALPQAEDLAYDPLQAEFLDVIQASPLGLSDGELAKLGENGFVISTRQAFPTFVNGYAAIYAAHLPVYISVDAALEAVHSSYDTILAEIEQNALIPALDRLLEGMHQRLAGADVDEATRSDVDEYLAVARSLLSGRSVAPLAGGDAAAVAEWITQATAADGMLVAELFGTQRLVDSSQFTPRGHYEDEPVLANYFRAMIWLGRIDLRIIETQPDGSTVFQPAQYSAMLLLRALMTDGHVALWNQIDAALRGFVGESDNMILPEVDALISDLGGAEAAKGASDSQVRAAFMAGGYGIQNIASHLMVNDGSVATLPLNRSFLLFGQRYVLDSHVFSQVVYDRIQDRMMPDPLDAAYAALGNDGALPLLPDLARFPGYPGALEATRVLADAHGEDFWGANLYNLWSAALRELSPTADPATNEGRPQVTSTDAWNRRILNTQLGSWAELRHDTLLYAKQSYTGMPSCDFPDAYVDPYPKAFARLASFADEGMQIAASLSELAATAGIQRYFQSLRDTMNLIAGMAENQADGIPFDENQMAFVNRAVRIIDKDIVCTTIDAPDGWLADLYYRPDDSIELDPTIADVHTQPADEAGNVVGKVLHVGTGYPRLMVVTAEGCSAPRAYVGVTFAYHEKVTKDFDRLTDYRWEGELREGVPASPTWLTPVLGE